MTALILVVDDIPSNIKLLEVKLNEKYYQVITAASGHEALKLAEEKQPDIILLDVMMPIMDGFETCQILKKNYSTVHIPVIIVTALNDIENKIQGLSCGADEFLIKPVNEFSLFCRIKSLLRFKVILDELRLRMNTTAQIGSAEARQILEYVDDIKSAKITVIDNERFQFNQVKEFLSNSFDSIVLVEDLNKLENYEDSDIFIINLSIDTTLLKVCSLVKSKIKTRLTPILAIVDDDDNHDFITQVIELGISDYIDLPLNENEFIARTTTQIKRKRYQDALEKSMENNLKMAVTDLLTGVYNRHYFQIYINELLLSIQNTNKTFSLMIFDIDHFKNVNDSYGHLSGDLILKQFTEILKKNLRINDLIVRFGGEEFLVILFDVELQVASETAERIKEAIDGFQFCIIDGSFIKVTASAGITEFQKGERIEVIIERADKNLYQAKESGRNKVVSN